VTVSLTATIPSGGIGTVRGGFSHPPTGRSLAAQLLHRQVLQDAIFDFVQVVVVRIEDVAHAVNVNLTTP